MSILVEIAGRADVSVEGVVRVLTKEPVSSTVKERVLEVLDQLDAEQTRVLERFALAAVHDVVPLSGEESDPSEGADASRPSVHEGQLALGESSLSRHPAVGGPDANGAVDSGAAELPVGLGTLLEELVSAVWEMRHESRSGRQERLDDLAVLVDLMTTSWQGVDRRLARLEQLVARRELPRPAPTPATPQFEPSFLQPVPDAAPPSMPSTAPSPPSEPPAAAAGSAPKRNWPPFVGTLLVVMCLVGAMLVFDLLPSRAEGPSFAPAREDSPGTTQATTGSSSTLSGSDRATEPIEPARTAPARPTTAASPATPRTTATAPRPQQPPAQPPRQTTTGAGQQTPVQGTTTPSSSQAIQPARVFVWPPVEGVDLYTVRFFRGGEIFYATRATEPRLAIPERIVFQPGTYRWVVSPHTQSGPDELGEPIIDSTFTVAKP